MRFRRLSCLVFTAGVWFGTAHVSLAAPFAVTASAGPEAGSHVIATVTRKLGTSKETLPAALVPALAPGDIVDLDFPDYRNPPSSVNYHVNAAFITETAPQRWLFERSGPQDALFTNHRSRGAHAVPSHGKLHFVYGIGRARGIPIVFIIPEDAKTRGVDGVRDYVDAHPSDFIAMSQSANAAVDRYSYVRDFLSSLGSGSIDPTVSRARIETLAQSFGVSPTTIEGCYAAGTSAGEINACIQQAVNSVVYQPNFNAPTQAQFLGGLIGAASPVMLAPYIASLLTVWHAFVHAGHQEYEYLPSVLALADPSTKRHEELLMGVKVPTIRPPAAYSDVMFFTIGDPQAAETAPVVVNDAPTLGVCERANRFALPLHFDHTSRYVHDAALTVTPDAGTATTIPLDPRTLAAPVVDRVRFPASPDHAYSVALHAQFGFAAVAQPAALAVRVAFPNAAPWRVTLAPHHPPIAGEELDAIAASPSAACLSRAELQIGSATPVALTVTKLDAGHVALRGSLTGLPAGPAHLRFYERDPSADRDLESDAALAIQPPPAAVDVKTASAALGDAFVRLTGTGLERIRALLVGGVTYEKEPDRSATMACFDGPALGARLSIGQQVTAQLIARDSSAGQVFPLTIAAPRPMLASVRVATPLAPVTLSTTTISVLLQGAASGFPPDIGVRVRQAPRSAQSPCMDSASDPTAVTLDAATVHERGPNLLALDFRADVLHDRAYGTLQLQLVPGPSGRAGNWVALPGTFARAPLVTQIACPADANVACRLYGTDLDAIDSVQDEAGTFVAPRIDCPPTDKGLACVFVPHVAHYRVRLIDAGAMEVLPDALIANAAP